MCVGGCIGKGVRYVVAGLALLRRTPELQYYEKGIRGSTHIHQTSKVWAEGEPPESKFCNVCEQR